MKTINKVGGVNGLSYTEFYGISTDIKPTDDTIPNGSVFYEIDHNMQEYRWDKENGVWRKISSATSDGGTPPSGEYLPLSGGIMTGDINMNNNNLTNVTDLRFGNGTYVKGETTNDDRKLVKIADANDNKLSVKAADAVENDELVTKFQMENANSKYLPLIGGTMQGNVNMDSFFFNKVGGMIIDSSSKGPQGLIFLPNTSTRQTQPLVFSGNARIYGYQDKLVFSPDSGTHLCLTSYAGTNFKNTFPFAFNGATFGNTSTYYQSEAQILRVIKNFVEENGPAQSTNNNFAGSLYYDSSKFYYSEGVLRFSSSVPIYVEGPWMYTSNGLATPVLVISGNPRTDLKLGITGGESGTSKDGILQIIGTDTNKRIVGLDGVPASDSDVTNKKYVDDAIGGTIPLTGTTEDNPVTGVVTFNGESTITGISTPVNDTDVATKKYADEIKEYGIEHNPVLDSGQEEFVLGQNDLAYVFKNSMVMDSGDRFYFADPVSLTDGRLVPFITSAMTGEEYHLLVGTYPKGVQDGTLAPVQIDGIATPTGDNMAVNKKYVDSITQNQVTIQKVDNGNMCINLTVDGDEASGILDLTDKNGNPVIVRGIDTPVQDTDAVNKKFLEDNLKNVSGGTSGEYVLTKDLDMKQYKLINTSAVEIYGGINDSANNTYFIRETSQASINTDTKIPEYVKVITGVHTGDTNQDVILRGIRAGQQKNDAVNYNQFKTLADSFERCQHDVESLNAWKMTFDENAVENTVNSIIKYTDVAYELTIASGEEQWYSYDLAMQSGYTPISATLVIDDTNPFVGHCSLDITPDGTYNALIYLKSQGDDKTCNCKVRLVWIKNQ